jgi:hypothetical protein
MLETRGKSKVSAKEVIAARKLKFAHPEMCRSCFDTLAMKAQVSTKNLNFSGACMSPMRNADPSIATQLNWIHRI